MFPSMQCQTEMPSTSMFEAEMVKNKDIKKNKQKYNVGICNIIILITNKF